MMKVTFLFAFAVSTFFILVLLANKKIFLGGLKGLS